MFTPTRRAAILGLAAGTAVACSPRDANLQGLLRVSLDSMPDSLDPLRGQFASSALLFKQLHAPLAEYSPSGGVAPGLALTWRSEDARVWRFTLREDLTWSDGTPLTSEDVVWTARRAVDPSTGFADLGDFFAVENARAALRGEMPPQAIGVEAPDLRTVIFRLDQPVAMFPILMREFYPLPRHAVEAHGEDWLRPEVWVSAGPYLLAARNALSFSLVKNPRFAAADSVMIEQIEISVIEDAAARARRFRAGDLDLSDRPPSDQIAFLRGELGDRLRGFRAPILTYLKVNCAQPHLRDARVRRALSHAIDRARLSTQFFNSEASPTGLVIPDRDVPAPPRDVTLAQALLSEAGFGPNNPLRITLRATAGDRDRLAVAIMDDLSDLGVETTLIATYPNDLYQAVDGGDYDLALARFDRGLKADAEFMIQPFTQDGFADNTNWTGSRRAEFDGLIDAASSELEAPARLTLLRDAEQVFVDELSSIPLLHERAYWMVAPRVVLAGPTQPQLWRDLDCT